MATVKVSRLTRGDVASLAEIDRVVFGGTFKENDFLSYLDNPIYCFFVAKIDERVIGYIGYMLIGGEGDIINIGILPELRGRGIGNMLMDAMVADLIKNNAVCVHLEVRESNTVAISLYKKYGFIATGVSKNHYKEPIENAIRMTKTL